MLLYKLAPHNNRKKSAGYFFEILGAISEDGSVAVIKGCKTNSKGMVVQGVIIKVLEIQ